MLNTFNILWKKHLSAPQQEPSDLHQLDNPNRTNSGSNAHLPSYAPCQIVPSPPPPRSSLRAIYWRPSSWASVVPADVQSMAQRGSRASAMKSLLKLVVILFCVHGGESRWLSSGIGECCWSGGWNLAPFTFSLRHRFMSTFRYWMFYTMEDVKNRSARKCTCIKSEFH